MTMNNLSQLIFNVICDSEKGLQTVHSCQDYIYNATAELKR